MKPRMTAIASAANLPAPDAAAIRRATQDAHFACMFILHADNKRFGALKKQLREASSAGDHSKWPTDLTAAYQRHQPFQEIHEIGTPLPANSNTNNTNPRRNDRTPVAGY